MMDACADCVRVTAGDSHPVYVGFHVGEDRPASPASWVPPKRSPLSAALEGRLHPRPAPEQRPPSARGFRIMDCFPWHQGCGSAPIDVPPRIRHRGHD